MIQNNFNIVFNQAVNICSDLFDISINDILSKSNKHQITDVKKLIVYKFYNLRTHNKDNLVNLLAKQFNCWHSNVVYWHHKAQELYYSDIKFKGNYDQFSSKLDVYIKKIKIS